MLRALLLILVLLVAIAIFLVWQGYVEAPRRDETGKIEVQVNPPEVGTATVEVPTIRPSRGDPANGGEPQPQPAPAPAPAQ